MITRNAPAPARPPAGQNRNLTPTPRSSAKPATRGTIREELEGDAYRVALKHVLPKHLTPERFVRVAIMAMTRNPKLKECDRNSFFSALMTLSQWGLEPDGRRAYLIPFQNRKRNIVECQVIIGYQGLVELVTNSGMVSYVHADVVCENDEFEFNKGELVQHRIDFKAERGAIFAVYAMCRFKDRSEKAIVMSRDEVEEIRARSKSPNEGPWVTDWAEMAKKTVFRRLTKWLPLSAQLRDAADLDEEAIDERRFNAARPVFSAMTADALLPAPAAVTPPDDPSPTPGGETSEPDEPGPETPPHEDGERQPEEPAAAPAPEGAPGRQEPSDDDPASGPPPLTPSQVELQAFLDESGFTFGDVQAWAVDTGWEPGCDTWGSIHDVPEKSARRLVMAKSGLLAQLHGRVKKPAAPAEQSTEQPAQAAA